ncbi:MAG TPA: PAS domain S-box protein, partial [Chitinophagaceae bacterium]|nr:PAS domain S-box protein [Chitinophagaceae bacterium]
MKSDNNFVVDDRSFLYNGSVLTRRMEQWAKYFAGAIVIIAVIALIGWQFNIKFLKHPTPRVATMNPVTAVLFIFSGVSFFLLSIKTFRAPKIIYGKILACITIAVALLQFISAVSGLNISIDTLLYSDQLAEGPGKKISYRMAPNTAFSFILAGLALLLLHVEIKHKRIPAQVIALIVCLVALLSLIGYLYEVNAFYGTIVYNPMAIPSAICFLSLSLAILFAKPGKGIMRELTSPFTGSFIARFLIPAAIIIPVMLGYLRLRATWRGSIALESGVALFVIAIILIFLFLTVFIVVSLNKRDLLKLHADHDLREREEQIQTIFNAAPDAVIVIDEKGEIIQWNPKAESLLGWSKNEVTGKLLKEVIIPLRFREAHQKGMEHFLRTGEGPLLGKVIETYALTKNGDELQVALNIAASSKIKNHYLFIGFLRDLTGQKKAEEKFKSLLDSAPDAMIIANEKGEIVLVNQQTESVFGYNRDELIGKPVEILIPVDFRNRHQGHRSNYFANPKIRSMGAGLELFAMRRDGTQFPVEISLSPLQTEEGLLVSASVRDITDRKKAEEKFRSLLDSAPDATVIVNEKGVIQMINLQTENLFGYSRDEMIGQPVEILIPEELRNKHVHYRGNFFGMPKIRNMGAGLELNAVKKSGIRFPVEISLSPLQTEEGLLVSASVRDITDRKKAEEKFRSLLDAAPDATVIVNEEGSIQMINLQTEKLFGYSREELINRPVEILMPMELRHKHLQHRENFFATPKVRTMGAGIELNAVKKDGSKFPVEISLSPIQTEEGLLVSASVRDITDRKRAAEQISYMAKLIEETSEAIFSSSTDLTIKTWNKAAEKLFGFTASEAVGQPTGNIIRPQMTIKERQLIHNELKEKGYWTGEISYLKKDDSPLYLLISNTVTRNPQGEVDGYVSVCRDISDRKRLEEQLKKTNAELEAFSYSVSHDLRAPLRGIIGFTAILEEDYSSKLDSEAKRITSVIRANTLKMGQLIDDLLAFSRTGKQELLKGPIHTQSMVNEIANELVKQYKGPDIYLDIQALPTINADKNTIRQVWINLISNAIKYSGNRKQPYIKIGSDYRDGQIVFYV